MCDLYKLDLSTMTWMNVSTSGTSPSPRVFHGFASANGKLYVFGGFDWSGGHPVCLSLLETTSTRDHVAVYHLIGFLLLPPSAPLLFSDCCKLHVIIF